MEKTDLAVNDDPAVVFGAVPRGFLHCVELRQRRHPHLPFFLAASVNQAQRETDSWIGYQIFSPPVSLSLSSFLLVVNLPWALLHQLKKGPTHWLRGQEVTLS